MLSNAQAQLQAASSICGSPVRMHSHLDRRKPQSLPQMSRLAAAAFRWASHGTKVVLCARYYRQWWCASSSSTDGATPLAPNERRMRSTSTFLIGSSCSASSRLRWRVNERSPTISERLATPSRRTRSNRAVRNQRHASTKTPAARFR